MTVIPVVSSVKVGEKIVIVLNVENNDLICLGVGDTLDQAKARASLFIDRLKIAVRRVE